MKLNRYLKAALLAVVGVALANASPQALASTLTDSYTNTFDIGGNTSDFSGSGSVASWIYWYGTVYGNTPMTNDITMDAQGLSTSGSLQVVCPFGTSGDQVVWFGTFDNQYGYDSSETANGLLYSNITFDIRVAPGTLTNSTGDFGPLQVGLQQSGFENGGTFYGNGITIPAAAANGWVHMSQLVDITSMGIGNVCGVDFKYTSFSGYPKFPITFWVDNVEVHLNPGPPPPNPTLSPPTPAMAGLNCIATVPGSGGQNNRYHLCTTNDPGYGFLDQPNVTYSWNLTQFPTNSAFGAQAHFFITQGEPGPFDQAADYNLANCIFITVQATGATNGSGGVMNFRYKTNLPAGNGMIFNTVPPTISNSLPTFTTNADMSVTTNAPANSNFWPVMPACSLNSASVLGTWSVTFNNITNVTLSGPGGVSTNFVFDLASAQLFASPVALLLGAQPNGTAADGQATIYSSFSVTGNDAPFTDNFATDTKLNTNIWIPTEANDTNGVVLVPPSAAFWIKWTLPDGGFSLQASSNAIAPQSAWKGVPAGTIQDGTNRAALVDTASLASPTQSFFGLVQRTFSQLIVLLPGQTLTPGTFPGYSGTATPADTIHPVNATVYAEDANFYPVAGVADVVELDSSDGNALLPNNAALVNGVGTFQIKFGTGGGVTNTVSAVDTSDGTKTGVNNTNSIVVN